MILKKPLFVLLTALVAVSAMAGSRNNKFGTDTKVCDPVLIYTGGSGRTQWDKINLRPYVIHDYADGHSDWFFDAFIFNELIWTSNNKKYYLCNAYADTEPATKEIWTAYIDYLFSDAHDLGALENIISSNINRLGVPQMKHKVIIGMCVPCMYHSKFDGWVADGSDYAKYWTKYNWGSINGVDMDFSKADHRLTAVKWFIDEVIRRFNEKNYKYIELAGFYCTEETLNPRVSSGTMWAQYNDYIRSKGYRSYWIPYWGWSDNTAELDNYNYAKVWDTTYKFDMAWWQPNYFFYKSDNVTLPEKKQLEACIRYAKLHGLGLELEFETSGKSNGLNNISPEMHQRLIDYIDTYQEKDVWANSSVAHYGGSQGFLSMDISSDATNHATMDRLSDIVAARQKAWAEKAGVTPVLTDEPDLNFAFAGQGEIIIDENCPNAAVYNLAGAKLFEGSGRFACEKSIYVVADGKGNSIKISVK